jgi:hypothetical protein
MRGRFRTWTRIRVNLQHVPEALRPPQEALDPNDTPDDWSPSTRSARSGQGSVSDSGGTRRKPSRARKAS